MLVIVAFSLFVILDKPWATWIAIVGWVIGLAANVSQLFEYIVISAFLIPVCLVLRRTVRNHRTKS
jgi:hypothetical protein